MVDLLRLLVCLLPASRVKNRLLSWTPGWRVHAQARVGPCLVWRVRRAELAAGAVIGLGNVFRELGRVTLDEGALFGQFNWVSASVRFHPPGPGEDHRGHLHLAHGAGVTSRHYLDASGGLLIGAYCTVGGVRSTVLTHSVNVRTCEIDVGTVRLGERALVLTNAVILPGVRVGDKVVVAADATVTSDLLEPETVYGGTPAKRLFAVPGAAYFTRPRPTITSPERIEALVQELRDRERAERR